MLKSLENEDQEIIFKVGQNYFYSETYRDMFSQVNQHYNLGFAYDTFLKKINELTPVAQDENFIEYDFYVPEMPSTPSQLETIPILPKSALLR